MSTSPDETIDLPAARLVRAHRSDAPDVAAAVGASLEHLAPFMPWAGPAAADPVHQAERAESTERAWDEGSEYVYVLRDAADDALIGMVGLHRRIGPRAIEIGYWMHVDHCGRGHATAAARALTEQGLALDDVDRVEIHTDEANRASSAIPPKLGYVLDRVDVRDPEAPGESGRLQIWVRPA